MLHPETGSKELEKEARQERLHNTVQNIKCKIIGQS
jgi:hypothetical protein